jgi:hypothetical protein
VTVQGPQWLPLERRLMATLQYVGARNVGVITMSVEWNGSAWPERISRNRGGHPRLAQADRGQPL